MRKWFAVAALSLALLLVGAGIVLALAASRVVRAGIHPVRPRAMHVEERSFSVTGAPTFALTTHHGGVTISRGDDAHVVVRAMIRAYPDATLDNLGVTLAQDGNAIAVTEHRDAGISLFGPATTIDYDVRVPAHTTVMPVMDTDGPIVVSDIIGTLELSGSNGPITVRGFDGSVTARSSNGHIFLSDGRGAVNLTTQNAAIDLQNVQATVMTVQSTNGHVSFHGTLAAGAKGQIETTNSPVTVSLPAASGFTLDARTTNGGVNVAFPVTVAPGGDRQSRNTVQGTIGAPDGTLTVRSTNGSITIGKQG